MKTKLLPLMTSNAIANYNQRVTKSSSCWEWSGTKDKWGYGRLSVSKNLKIAAHRFSYALHKGVDPAEFCICHRCDNPECTNPDHLFIATQKENSQDRNWKNRTRGLVGESNHKAKLTFDDVEAILSACLLGIETNKQIAERYGIHHSTVSAIKLGKLWHKCVTSKNAAERK